MQLCNRRCTSHSYMHRKFIALVKREIRGLIAIRGVIRKLYLAARNFSGDAMHHSLSIVVKCAYKVTFVGGKYYHCSRSFPSCQKLLAGKVADCDEIWLQILEISYWGVYWLAQYSCVPSSQVFCSECRATSPNRGPSYVGSAMCPECPSKDPPRLHPGKATQRLTNDQVVWLRLQPALVPSWCGVSRTISGTWKP